MVELIELLLVVTPQAEASSCVLQHLVLAVASVLSNAAPLPCLTLGAPSLAPGDLQRDAGGGVLDEEHVQGSEDNGQGEDSEVEQESDRRGPLHVVHPVLGQPVE